MPALSFIDRAVALDPKSWLGHFNRACILNKLNRAPEALSSAIRAVEIEPENALGYDCSAVALMSLGRNRDAIAALHQALILNPQCVDAHFHLGNALNQLGEREHACRSYSRVLNLDPRHLGSLNNLANVLQELKRSNEAEACLRRAIEVEPSWATGHANLGKFLRNQQRYGDALVHCERAVELDPVNSAYAINLGLTYLRLNRVDEGIRECKRALHTNPHSAAAVSSLLFIIHYDPESSPEEIFNLHAKWAERLPKPTGPAIHRHRRNDKKHPRVAYVSPDLGKHPVGYFLLPVIQAHLPSFECTLYSNREIEREDQRTRLFEQSANKFVRVAGLDPEDLAKRIADDQIDILVDLAGHTANNSLPAFRYKPAPVQVSWLGYFNTTGIGEIDYVLGDPVVVPPELDPLFVEKIWRLPDSYLCYRGPDYAGAVAKSPCDAHGAVTFGTFNAVNKINRVVAATWAAILQRVPRSRLLLRNANFRERDLAVRCRRLFEEYGVASDRLVLLPPLEHASLLDSYSLLDVALDPFPYNGGTTTAEALWMGVPVVTLAGQGMVGRVSASIISAAGHPEWVAQNVEEYVEIAVGLAQNRERLAELRGQQRDQIIRSPLGDVERFTRNLEVAYRQMWERWCDQQG